MPPPAGAGRRPAAAAADGAAAAAPGGPPAASTTSLSSSGSASSWAIRSAALAGGRSRPGTAGGSPARAARWRRPGATRPARPARRPRPASRAPPAIAAPAPAAGRRSSAALISASSSGSSSAPASSSVAAGASSRRWRSRAAKGAVSASFSASIGSRRSRPWRADNAAARRVVGGGEHHQVAAFRREPAARLPARAPREAASSVAGHSAPSSGMCARRRSRHPASAAHQASGGCTAALWPRIESRDRWPGQTAGWRAGFRPARRRAAGRPALAARSAPRRRGDGAVARSGRTGRARCRSRATLRLGQGCPSMRATAPGTSASRSCTPASASRLMRQQHQAQRNAVARHARDHPAQQRRVQRAHRGKRQAAPGRPGGDRPRPGSAAAHPWPRRRWARRTASARAGPPTAAARRHRVPPASATVASAGPSPASSVASAPACGTSKNSERQISPPDGRSVSAANGPAVGARRGIAVFGQPAQRECRQLPGQRASARRPAPGTACARNTSNDAAAI